MEPLEVTLPPNPFFRHILCRRERYEEEDDMGKDAALGNPFYMRHAAPPPESPPESPRGYVVTIFRTVRGQEYQTQTAGQSSKSPPVASRKQGGQSTQVDEIVPSKTIRVEPPAISEVIPRAVSEAVPRSWCHLQRRLFALLVVLTLVLTLASMVLLRRGEAVAAASPYHLVKEWVPTAAYSRDAAYGGIVRLSANGRRLFVSSSLPANVQVWEETPIGWKWQSQIPLVNGESDAETKLLDLAVDDLGTCLVVSVETVKGDAHVRVYESADGTNWELGEGLDLTEALVNASGSSPTRGQRVAMSGDGRIIAVAMPYVNRRSSPEVVLYNRTGVVQIFQKAANHTVAKIESNNSSSSSSTWIPMGLALRGYLHEERLGERLALTADGSRLVVSRHLFSPTSPGVLQVYQWQEPWWILVNASISIASPAHASNVLSLSRSGEYLVVAEADALPKGRGDVRVYHWDAVGTTYRSAWQSKGNQNDLHWGMTVAVAEDATLVVTSRANPVLRGAATDRVVVYRRESTENDTTLKWQADGLTLQQGTAYSSASISTDGRRIALGASHHVSYAEEGARYGLVTLWDRDDLLDG